MTLTLVDREPAREPVPASRSLPLPVAEILADFRTVSRSRQVSLLGRKEVLTGKAKFGIFGDGKEVAQVALARSFRPGDFRSGYYRDQTLLFALGLLTVEQFFAQLYADADLEREPCSAGRSMTAHFGTFLVDADGRFLDLANRLNSSSDVSPTGSQMPRLVGLAYASRLYRGIPELAGQTQFSHHGDEIAWGTIGNASCAEGMFWEAVNAAGVLQAPMLLSVWDDGYGISVPNEMQLTKGNLSELLAGFRRQPGKSQGYDLYTVNGWDYPTLVETYRRAAEIVRREHVPAVVHAVEMTQPQGHSTSGSHERYKSKDRLEWEREHDPLRQMRLWMVGEDLATDAELDAWEDEDRDLVRQAQEEAWKQFRAPIEAEKRAFLALAGELARKIPPGPQGPRRSEVEAIAREIEKSPAPLRRDLAAAAHSILLEAALTAKGEPAGEARSEAVRLAAWRRELEAENEERYGSDVYSETERSALRVPVVQAVYAAEAPLVDGFKVMNACFDAAFATFPHLVALGEDLGKIGDVNQGFAGLQKKYGELRISDTGIRETTILGQAIGMAMRGLRPIAEIQYLDYILYALQIISDDLATVRYRSAGRQIAPVIVRTRGHRLEGVWHSGSPMAAIIHLVRGLYVCVPRNMVQAAGFYNTLLRSDDPGLIVEVLNGYRIKEKLPANIGDFTVPLGVPEVLRAGTDVTVVTYGACCRIVLEAADRLTRFGIECEVIDVQTLLPFDREGRIALSLQKTNRIVFVDEDVPGGTSAYMLQQVIEKQRGYLWLDSEPRTLPAREHRPAYGSDGDYWSKPNREQIFETVYELMHETAPAKFPRFYR